MIYFLFKLFVIYLIYKLVVDFIIPIYRTTSQMKEKMNEMQRRMNEERAPENRERAANTASKPVPPKDADYIDFEEVK